LGRLDQAGRLGNHAEPEDLGRCALELSRCVGVGVEATRRQRREGEGVRAEALQERSRARYGRTRLDDDVRKVDIVYPSFSILAEPPVAVVDKTVLRRGTREIATEYLKYLYSPEAQEIIARNFYRPIDPNVAAKYEKQFPKLELVTIEDFGGWAQAHKVHFADGAIFDQITKR